MAGAAARPCVTARAAPISIARVADRLYGPAFMKFVTDFADQAVILPLAATVAAVLAVAGWRRGALAWVAWIGGTLALVLALKLASAVFGHLLPAGELRSPSGHTASAGAVYGGMLAGLAQRLTGHNRWSLACVVVAVAAVGASRLALDMHTLLDVAVGSAVGVGGGMALVRSAGAPPRDMPLAPVAAAALLVIATFHGAHLVLERPIRDAATWAWSHLSDRRTGGSGYVLALATVRQLAAAPNSGA